MTAVVQDKYDKGCYYVDGQQWQVRVWAYSQQRSRMHAVLAARVAFFC
jgi:hypothetical protein